MQFTSDEDDSVDSDDQISGYDAKLKQALDNTRSWIMKSSDDIFRELAASQETMRIIPTPAHKDTAPPMSQLMKRWDYLMQTMMDVLIQLVSNADITKSHPVMSQFITYLGNDKQVIPIDFLLPFERKVV